MRDVLTATTDLIGDVTGTLTAAGRPVLRAFVAPAGPPPWDNCCAKGTGEGQAWVQVERVYPTDSFPDEAAAPLPCGPMEYAAILNVGVLRCAKTVDDKGNPPTAAEMTAEAVKNSHDRDTVLRAIMCDFLPDAYDAGEWTYPAWIPLGPDGGCVGGLWRFTVAAPACPCP